MLIYLKMCQFLLIVFVLKYTPGWRHTNLAPQTCRTSHPIICLHKLCGYQVCLMLFHILFNVDARLGLESMIEHTKMYIFMMHHAQILGNIIWIYGSFSSFPWRHLWRLSMYTMTENLSYMEFCATQGLPLTLEFITIENQGNSFLIYGYDLNYTIIIKFVHFVGSQASCHQFSFKFLKP